MDHRPGLVLVVEDDPGVRSLLDIVLTGEGHRAAIAPDGATALELVARGDVSPDLILADYNLPNGPNGVQLATRLREKLGRELPVIILTGDISTETLREISLRNCTQLNKPVKLKDLTDIIRSLLVFPHLETRPRAAVTVDNRGQPVIFIVDDDAGVRASLRAVLEDAGRIVEDYAACEAFLDAYRPGREGCLLIDAYMPGMGGLELIRRLTDRGDLLPAIMITGSGDVALAVQAMKAGASDFIEKPLSNSDLLASVERALRQSHNSRELSAWRETAADCIASLTVRQRQIMDLVLAGHPSKNIATDLGISQRTVENHRASIMKKTGSKSLPALARLALAAASGGAA